MSTLPKPLTIAVVGPHYSGKSTLCELFAKQARFTAIKEEWWKDPTRDVQPRDYFHAQMWYLLQTSQSLVKAKRLKAAGQSVILDTFMYSTCIFSTTVLSATQMQTFNAWVEFLATTVPLPDVVIYLHANIDFLYNQRRQTRLAQGTGPKGEDKTSYEWFKCICELNSKYFDSWSLTPLLKIDTQATDFLHDPSAFTELMEKLKAIKNI